jgi:hypothetical protein
MPQPSTTEHMHQVCPAKVGGFCQALPPTQNSIGITSRQDTAWTGVGNHPKAPSQLLAPCLAAAPPHNHTWTKQHHNTQQVCDAQQRPQQVWGMQYPKAPCCQALASPWVGHTQTTPPHPPGLSHGAHTNISSRPAAGPPCTLLLQLIMVAASKQNSMKVTWAAASSLPWTTHQCPQCLVAAAVSSG